MSVFNILTMIGGLALFLYGMSTMGDGLAKVSGGKLEQILEKLTSNPIKAVILGAGVTAVIQSSSATTVMVVGFVNSGIMKLHQTVGIIMGANVGTTATSWILSLSGIEGDSFFIKLLKPTSFSPILALIGIIFIMFTKNQKKKDIGSILVGFAILMFGMDTMSGAVAPLADVPEFTNILTMFSQPVLGVLAGLVLTAVIQSSSASVGILQALCVTGSLSFSTALPIIMGQNIGTCVTALLACVGAKKNAKRAAFVHFYFNLIGTVLFMLIFYLLNAVVDFSFLDKSASPAGIAIIHSAFNISATLILLPFGRMLERLACLTIRDKEGEEEVTIDEDFMTLDYRFLDQPGFAMEQCKNVAADMANLSKEALFLAFDVVTEYDEKKAQKVFLLEDRVDKYEDELGTYLVKLSSRSLGQRDSHTLSVLLHCIGDFERMSDHAINIVQAVQEMQKKEQLFSPKAQRELAVYTLAMKDIINMAVTVFENEDTTLARQIEPLEEVIDTLNAELKKRHVKRLRKGKCTIELGFVLSDITTSYERVSDHCSNIAVCLIQMQNDEFETHGYLENIKHSDDSDFSDQFHAYQEKYVLP